MKTTKKINLMLMMLVISMAACEKKSEKVNTPIEKQSFNDNWQFVKDIKVDNINDLMNKTNSVAWSDIEIPHTANIEPSIIKGKQWQGDAVYRKFFTVQSPDKDKHLALRFEGAMTVAQVYLNGELLATNKGGYLPFYVEISNNVKFDDENCLVVKLNNEDNKQVPPGRPLDMLDFNIFSGIYRNVWLISKNKLHISDAINANKVAGGGIFVSYPSISKQKATVSVKVDVVNENTEAVDSKIEIVVKNCKDELIAKSTSELKPVDSNKSTVFEVSTSIENPLLWSPKTPHLYTLQVNIIQSDNTITDTEELKIGLRNFSFSAKDGFVINGEKLKIRGTNRHQEYPYIGYALSDNANYRDACKIKQAGFNFVRLSHYPHTESFINACDELGILVMDAIPGWQFFGDSVFQENSINDVRKMVRRDRNHPSIILWEASLNESEMTADFMALAHNAVHQEIPQGDVYTCGWLDSIYDVFIPARQHGKAPTYWNNYAKDKPLLIAEYGDWEYYAQNAGFNQKEFKDLAEEERTSRQLREHGQKRLLQQALNYQESHNSNLQGVEVGDANWLMFDYNRGYAPDIEASGIMDIFRLPKFAFWFYQSQADETDCTLPDFYKPMIAIANYYNDPTLYEIKIYSNCDEVELFVNNKSIGKQKPDTDKFSTHIKHPPFTFKINTFEAGNIRAVAYKNDVAVVETSQNTPLEPTDIKLWIDESGIKPDKNKYDVVFVYAAIVDKNGTIVPNANNEITFDIEGNAELIGDNPAKAEAGIATIILKTNRNTKNITIDATANGLKYNTLNL